MRGRGEVGVFGARLPFIPHVVDQRAGEAGEAVGRRGSVRGVEPIVVGIGGVIEGLALAVGVSGHVARTDSVSLAPNV